MKMLVLLSQNVFWESAEFYSGFKEGFKPILNSSEHLFHNFLHLN